MTATTFDLEYADGLAPLFTVFGMGPRWSRVRVDEDRLEVGMGWAFRASIPRSAVVQAEPDDRPVGGWGVHGWRGRWLVNGSSQGLVRLELDPPTRAWVLGVPVRLRQLRLSVHEPDALVAALR